MNSPLPNSSPIPRSLPHTRSGSSQFLIAHARSSSKLALVDDVNASSAPKEDSHSESMETDGRAFLGGLIKPPIVRQFLHGGHLYKEEHERDLSHFELFADLIFVAIVHLMGDLAAEEANVAGAVKFILMFWPPWSIWADMRSYLNVSGTDDVTQRIYILISSFLLIGYTAQGASVELMVAEGKDPEATTLGDSSSHETIGLDNAAISEEGYVALRSAIGFFLVAKALRIAILLVYAWALPRFRIAHLVQIFFTIIPCLFFFRLFFVSSVVDAMAVFALGVVLDIVGKYLAGIVVHMGVNRKNKHKYFIPALEIGHVIEKTAAFFVLVTGEILIAVAYIAKDKTEIGPHGEYWRSCLGVSIAFFLCWLYFDADSSKVFVHAIRRHWFSSITWTQLHLPLCASLVIAAAAMHKMILYNSVDQALRWYFAIGMSVLLFCLGLMGFLHRSLDKPGSSIIPRWVRLGLRMVLSVFFAAFPLFSNDSSVLELGVYAAGLAALVLVETVGKIGSVGHTAPPKELDLSPSPYGAETLASPAPMTPQPGAHSSSVEYLSGHKRFKRDDLTAYEKGEEDVGGETGIGLMRAVSVRRGQREYLLPVFLIQPRD
ncbi:hypothetical protein CPB86DRAFT_718994 [Serendipita vermifera]|nr:hypothetical protein CPB86DRAFT_718994 [Serendipita vermifera]